MKRLAALCIVLLTALSGCRQEATPDYTVYAVAFTDPIRMDGRWISNRNAPDSITGSFMVWLIQGGEKKILLDAGYVLSDSARKTDRTGYIRPDSALIRFGVKPDEVTDVIISHPHWDHIGGIGLFPNATVWMQQDDFDYFVDGAWKEGGNSIGLDTAQVRLAKGIQEKGRLALVRGDSLEIIPGIRVFIGSKHTWESQYVQVTTGDERIILASDNIWFYHNYDNLLSASITFDTAAYIHQMKRMKTLASSERLIIPGHDSQIFERFPTVAAGVVRISSN
jgi:glyoxylase-like metal-dependent hydrolase (beta-lactamase superfamily II)